MAYKKYHIEAMEKTCCLRRILLRFIRYIILVICTLVNVAFVTLLERKILGYSQLRKGPNKVRIIGVAQPFNDAIKLFSKELVFPNDANLSQYFLAPICVENPVAKKSPEKSKSKTPENVSKSPEKELFTAAEFKPVDKIEKEIELSFEGQGLKLNTAEDAADVAAKISSHGPMHVLTFSANTIGIEAAGAIGKALEKHPEFRRAHWKDMFTGRMKTEIPPALVNLTRGIMTAQARLVELDLSDNAFGPA